VLNRCYKHQIQRLKPEVILFSLHLLTMGSVHLPDIYFHLTVQHLSVSLLAAPLINLVLQVECLSHMVYNRSLGEMRSEIEMT